MDEQNFDTSPDSFIFYKLLCLRICVQWTIPISFADAIAAMRASRSKNNSEETKSLTKSDSSSDSGVVDVCKNREMKSASDISDEAFEWQPKNERQLSGGVVADGRQHSFENVNLQPKWHCPPKNIWKPTVEVR